MKSQFRTILFALIIPACGGDSQSPLVTSSPTSTSHVLFVPEGAVITPANDSHVSSPVAQVSAPEGSTPVVADKAPPTQFDDALAQGRALEAKGDQVAAREMFEAAIKLDKRRAEPHVELARSYISTGDKALAVAAAKKAIKLAPDSSQAWNTMGRAELARFEYDSAIEAFTKSTELNKANVWAWNNLGFTELTLKKYEDAVVHLQQATSLPGATGFMFNNLGTALEQLDRLDEARVAYDDGGKLGSRESAASRKRLDGVKSIALAKEDTTPIAKDGKVKGGGKVYELNEGQLDEDKALGSDVDPKDGPKDPPKDAPKPEAGSGNAMPTSL